MKKTPRSGTLIVAHENTTEGDQPGYGSDYCVYLPVYVESRGSLGRNEYFNGSYYRSPRKHYWE